MNMISIIIPVYNVKSYLSRCIESLMAQEYDDIEIILVDDGSTDGSAELCDSYMMRDTRIRSIHKANGGLSSARNAGLGIARGQYIMFLDGDDYLAAPYALSALMDIIRSDGELDFIQFQYIETDGSWSSLFLPQANISICTDTREMFKYLYTMGGVAASACTKLYKAELFNDLRFREGIHHEDEELITHLLFRCKRVAYTDLILYGYVMRPTSITHDIFNSHKLDVLAIMDDRIKALEEHGYNEFVPQTKSSQFCTAAQLYCQARRSHDSANAKILKDRLISLSRANNVPLSGQYKLLRLFTRVTSLAPNIYYAVRRIFRKS